MPRPRKNPVVETPKQETVAVEPPKKDDGLVALNHYCQKGRMIIDNETYEIKGGVVRVKPEHLAKAKEHISLMGR